MKNSEWKLLQYNYTDRPNLPVSVIDRRHPKVHCNRTFITDFPLEQWQKSRRIREKKNPTYNCGSVDVVGVADTGVVVEDNTWVVVWQHCSGSVVLRVFRRFGRESRARFRFVRANSGPFLVQAFLVLQPVFHVWLKMVWIRESDMEWAENCFSNPISEWKWRDLERSWKIFPLEIYSHRDSFRSYDILQDLTTSYYIFRDHLNKDSIFRYYKVVQKIHFDLFVCSEISRDQ